MCGKNPAQKYMCFREEGSPPHVREELACLSLAAAQLGITPACAGRIRGAFLLLPFFKDHPRMCGKNRFRTGDVTDVWGSPPHVREEFKNVSTGQFEYGITPAHAGRIPFAGSDPLGYSGSPPRMREEFLSRIFLQRIPGITPAHAGRIG